MAERTEYAPGIFSWADLSTTDPEAAKSFYAALFGWQSEDLPVPGGSVYSMQQAPSLSCGSPRATSAPGS